MNQHPDLKVSVCVLAYQHEKFIEKCLNSILEQNTNFQYEIIIGEDESSDGTRKICEKYAHKYPERIRLFLRSRENVRYINGNPTGRYNFIETLKSANGKYIAFCDGDDYWTDKNKLQKQTQFMEDKQELSMSLHNAYQVDEHRRKTSIFPDIKEKTIISPEKIIEKGGGFCATNSIMFRRNILDEMPNWFVDAFVGDYSVYLLAITYGKVGALPDIMSCYRTGHKHSWSRLSNQTKNVGGNLKSLKSMLHDFNNYSYSKYEKSVKTKIALEEIYSAIKILISGKLFYFKTISIEDKRYILSAFIKIMKRKLGFDQ